MAIITLNNNSLSSVTSLPTGVGNGLVKIASQTVSSDVTNLVFDNTVITGYSSYLCRLENVSGVTNPATLRMQFSTDNGSTFLSTVDNFNEYHQIDGLNNGRNNYTSQSYVTLSINQGNEDEGMNAVIELYNLNSSTLQKHGHYMLSYKHDNDYYQYQGGFAVKTTTAINALRFNFSAGDIDAGKFSIYGVRT